MIKWSGVTSQLRSVIEWENPDKDTLFQLWSGDGDEIKNASKLIVKPGQGVIFMYEGRIEDVHYKEGLYELQTDNIPFITTLKKFMQGFESEHKVGIYFFWQTKFLDQKWGTVSPIKYDDPVYKFPVGLRARGNFTFRLQDPKHFFVEVVGSEPSYSVSEARKTIVARLQQPLVDTFAESGFSYAEIDRNRDELGKALTEKLDADFYKLGFELADFRIEGTDFDEDTERRIDRIADMAAEAEAVKRVGLNYAQSQQLEALRDAARNEGGVAGLGVGVGAGMGLGQQMAQSFNSAALPQGVGGGDPVTRLEKLKKLLDGGLITQDEYDEKKKSILSEI